MPSVRRRDALLALAVIVLATIVRPYLPELLIPLEPEVVSVPVVDTAVVVQKWCEAGLAAGLLACFMLRHGLSPAAFGLRRDQIGRQVLWSFATLGGVYVALLASAIIIVPLYLISPGVEGEIEKRVEFVEAMPVDNLAVTITLLVAVALHEELVFRGLLLPYLRRLLGSWWWAGLVSASIFAALHVPTQGVMGGIQVFGIAVVLTLFFILTRSLLTVTLAHLLFDFLQFQLVRLLPDLRKLLEAVEA
jgi:membrane protease YdiL (CAAX protease family)